MPNESSQQVPPILPMLEAVAATAAVMPWGCAALPSLGRVFAWDCRPDASAAILDAIASQVGDVEAYRSITTESGRNIIGVLIAPKGGETSSLDEIAGDLRARYHIATGPDPRGTEGPF